jgi:alanyl-tRNA synthetase
LTEEQLKKVEDMVNDIIAKDLPVHFSYAERRSFKNGAIHAFNEKYSDTVKVYTIGPTSPRLGGRCPSATNFAADLM